MRLNKDWKEKVKAEKVNKKNNWWKDGWWKERKDGREKERKIEMKMKDTEMILASVEDRNNKQ